MTTPGGAEESAIAYFFSRKATKEQRVHNARSLKNRVAELAPPAVQQMLNEVPLGVTPEVASEALQQMRAHGQADDLQRLLTSFPVFGGSADRVVREEELDGLVAENLGTEGALIALRTMDLVEPMEQLGEWQLTPIGESIVRGLILEDSEACANALDAQAAFLTGRLVADGRAAEPLLEASVYLLTHGLMESEAGHPTRWGTVMRTMRNAVVVDLERPDSLLAGSGGLRAKDLEALGGMAAVSPLAEGSIPAEIRTLVVVLEARERIQNLVGASPDHLKEVLLDPSLYEPMERQLTGLKAMAHVAWVALTGQVERERELQDLAEGLAHAVTGVRRGGVFQPSDFALLTPDHREHLLLVAAAKENPVYQLAGSLGDARRRLAMVYGQLAEEYPHVGERTRAAARILGLHTAYGEFSEDRLIQEAGRVMEAVEESAGFTDELTALAMRLQPGLYGQDTSTLALHTLVRRYCDADDLTRPIDYTDTMVAAAEWVAVAERFSQLHTMKEAQLYRYALMEALERPGFKKPQREGMDRMLAHSTSLMTVLAQQDQSRTIPQVEKEILSGMSTQQLLEIIEGDGGRFGVARIPWQEGEREQTFRRMVEFSGLKVAFPEEMNLVSRNLLHLLGTHVAPGDPRRRMDVPQQELLERHIGEVSGDLNEAEARDGLAFIQAVETAKVRGILRTYPGAGVSIEEAARAHDIEYTS